MKNNILSNVENYNLKLDANESILFLKYIGLIHEIVECSAEKVSIEKKEYLRYILIKAIKNTLYIFTILLLYTKNLDLTIYHTQKSILYFIEFIGQLGDENHNFLKLNSKDATLFVYKKTIFEIDSNYRKEFKESLELKKKLETFHLFAEFYNEILIKFIDEYNFKENSMNDLEKIVFTKLYKIVENIIQLPLHLKKREEINSHLENLIFITDLYNQNYRYSFINTNYFYLIETTVKKSLKKGINKEVITNKLEKNNIEDKLSEFSVCKIVNYIFSSE